MCTLDSIYHTCYEHRPAPDAEGVNAGIDRLVPHAADDEGEGEEAKFR